MPVPSPDTLMRQAVPTMADYLRESILAIDAQLGEGYAKEHPELLAAFIQGASLDYGLSFVGNTLIGVASALGDLSP